MISRVVALYLSLASVTILSGPAGAQQRYPLAKEFFSAWHTCQWVPGRFVHKHVSDSLSQYAHVLTNPYLAEQIMQSGDASLSTIRVLGDHPAVLVYYKTPDGDSVTLRRLTPELVRVLRKTKSTLSLPQTAAGISLGDPISKVIAKFGPGTPKKTCDTTTLGYAWEGQYGDTYIDYEYDADDRIVSIESGNGCCGIRHMWEHA
jgi:hypothetical protein